MPQFNIVLLGKAGSGVSASGNTILHNKTFPSALRSQPTTTNITKGNVTIDGTHLTVYDTPGLFDTGRRNDEVLTQWRSLLQLEESDPTVFLLVLRVDRFTEEQRSTVQHVEDFLGERRMKNTWILFTRGDLLVINEMTIEELIEDSEDIKIVVERFEGRYHVFNNRDLNLYQVKELIRKITEAHKELATGSPPLPLQTSRLPERRLVLLGKTGAGRSATGNTVLGGDRFHSEGGANSVTAKSEVQQAAVAGKLVTVVDTPGLFDTGLTQEEMVLELGTSIYECSPGPHAFLIVVQLNARFTQQEKQVTDIIRAFYGEGVLKYTIILFTCGDQLEGRSVEYHIKCNKALSDLVNRCGERYHVFNNKDKRNRLQVTELLEKIDKMVEENGGRYYTNEMLQDAMRCRAEESQQREREKEERERLEKQHRQEETERAIREAEERIRREMEEELHRLRINYQGEMIRLTRQVDEKESGSSGDFMAGRAICQAEQLVREQNERRRLEEQRRQEEIERAKQQRREETMRRLQEIERAVREAEERRKRESGCVCS